MNSKGHLYTSIAKSALRIGACLSTLKFNDLKVLAIGFAIAEVLGILEEIFDER